MRTCGPAAWGDGSRPLVKIARVLVVTTANRAVPGNPGIFQFAVSPSGEQVLWSARLTDEPGAKEVLLATSVANPGTPETLATDVSRWSLSRDGRHLFWLRGWSAPVPTGPGQGTLERVSYPVRALVPVTLGQARQI